MVLFRLALLLVCLPGSILSQRLYADGLITAKQYSEISILTANPQQGSMILGQYKGEGEVFFGKHKLARTEDGLFVFGVGRDAAEKVSLMINEQGKKSVFSLPITKRQWKLERVDGLPPSKVTPKSKQTLARIKTEARLVKAARTKQSELLYFSMPFVIPAKGRFSGVFGSQRILNGVPKRPHFGLDIANKTGTPVIAPADGVVSLTHADMFYSGGTLVIDHGFGISSTYIHLSTIDVKPGQAVKQGEVIAKIGATGRVTGPHLDWRLNWFNTRLDPELLIK